MPSCQGCKSGSHDKHLGAKFYFTTPHRNFLSVETSPDGLKFSEKRHSPCLHWKVMKRTMSRSWKIGIFSSFSSQNNCLENQYLGVCLLHSTLILFLLWVLKVMFVKVKAHGLFTVVSQGLVRNNYSLNICWLTKSIMLLFACCSYLCHLILNHMLEVIQSSGESFNFQASIFSVNMTRYVFCYILFFAGCFED